MWGQGGRKLRCPQEHPSARWMKGDAGDPALGQSQPERGAPAHKCCESKRPKQPNPTTIYLPWLSQALDEPEPGPSSLRTAVCGLCFTHCRQERDPVACPWRLAWHFFQKLRKQSRVSWVKVQSHNALKCLANPLAPPGHEAQVCGVTATSLHPNVDAGSQQRRWRSCCLRTTPCMRTESNPKTLSGQTALCFYHEQRRRRNPSRSYNPSGCRCGQYWW